MRITQLHRISFCSQYLNRVNHKGIDFTGGRNYVIRFAQDVKTDEVRNLLDAQLDGSVSVIQIGTPRPGSCIYQI